MPFASTALLEHGGGAGIELALHQTVHQVDDGHLRAGLGEAVGGFETEQSAADHDCSFSTGDRRRDRRYVAEVAEGEHARQVHARHS